jgi:hypothetical protein
MGVAAGVGVVLGGGAGSAWTTCQVMVLPTASGVEPKAPRMHVKLTEVASPR